MDAVRVEVDPATSVVRFPWVRIGRWPKDGRGRHWCFAALVDRVRQDVPPGRSFEIVPRDGGPSV